MQIERPKSRPWIAIVLLLAFLPEGMPIRVFGRAPSISFFDVAFVAVVSWLLAKAFAGTFDFSFQDRTLSWLVALYVLANLLSFLFNPRDPQRSVLAIKVIVFGYCVYLIALSTVFSRQAVRRITNGLIFFGCANALLLVYGYLTQWSTALDTQLTENPAIIKSGIQIAGGGSNYLASFLLPIVLLAFAKVFSSLGKQGLFWLGPSLILLLGLAITLSKAATLSLGVGVLVSGLFLKTKILRLKALAAISTIALLLLLVVPADLYRAYFWFFSQLLESSDPLRVVLFETAWSEFVKHPLLGIGPGCIYIYNRQAGIEVLNTHNYILNALADLGLLGAVPFFAVLIVATKRALRLPSLFATGSQERTIAIGLCAGLVASLVHGLVEPTFAGQEYLAVFCVIMSLMSLYGRYRILPECDPPNW